MNKLVESEAQEWSESPGELALPPGELLVGTLIEFDSNGYPRVKVATSGGWQTLTATPAISLNAQHLGRQAVLMLAGGDIQAPMLLGFVFSALDAALEQPLGQSDINRYGETELEGQARESSTRAPMEAEVDDGRTVIEGERQVVLRCGEASITLTRAGKIILRGKHLVSRSSGTNRIMGGSIQMN